MINKQLAALGLTEFHPCNQNYVGRYFKIENRYVNGTYWLYEKNGFLLDIQDFAVKDDYVSTMRFSEKDPCFISTYFKRANGEFLSPYIPMRNNSLFTYIARKNTPHNSILHGGFPCLAVGLKFSISSLDKINYNLFSDNHQQFEKIFLEYNDKKNHSIKIVSDYILTLDKTLPGVDLILDGKIMEWLGISISSYYNNLTSERLLKEEDILAIEKVTNYIDNHYMLDLHQGLLEKIALMGGTKLKKSFKIKTGLTITEYSRRALHRPCRFSRI